MKRIQNIKLPQFLRFNENRKNRILRKALRAKGFYIYTNKRRAISMGKRFSSQERQVYWVQKETIGYYVVNLDHIRRLNNSNLKFKGGTRIHTRDLTDTCEWRSPSYESL
ncbi:MAG: hypothetical protein KAR19_03610 [Bacteroidales bacterium]|nr:hypothetical protein [Bacteroidales bacterium]